MPAPVFFQHFQVEQRPDGGLRELGRGAMGITYKAFDTNLQCPVALKIINATLTDNEHARERFLREARAAARLRHPNVATVLHLGKDDRSYFYAMEFIEGETLEAFVVRQGPVAPVLALEIVQQVARALGAAQNEGLVHRDIKPANLMLVRHRGEDEEGVHVKVIDFGLAKFIDAGKNNPGSLNLTMNGGFVGSPYYASPEQVEETEIDTRSDIYSLGATLWYLLAGEPPFTGSLGQVLAQHLERTPPYEKLEARGIPAPVLPLLRRLLAKKPADRPADPVVLRREITACLRALGAPAASSASTTDGKEAIIATHYLVLGDLGESEIGHVFSARDRRNGQAVTVTKLFRGLLRDPAILAGIERTVAITLATPIPGLVAVHALERSAEGDFLIAEPIAGFSFVEVMRARGNLSATEVFPLLQRAAVIVDAAAASGVHWLPLNLRTTHVHFPGQPPAESARRTLLSGPVSAWPPFELKFDALDWQSDAEQTLDNNARTLLPARLQTGAADGGPAITTRRLAEWVYELLGGTLPAASAAHYPPLTNLSESGNAALQRVLSGDGAGAAPYDSARAFAQAVIAGVPPVPSAPAGSQSPARQSAADTRPPPPLDSARSGATSTAAASTVKPVAAATAAPEAGTASGLGGTAAITPKRGFPLKGCLLATGIAVLAIGALIAVIVAVVMASEHFREKGTAQNQESNAEVEETPADQPGDPTPMSTAAGSGEDDNTPAPASPSPAPADTPSPRLPYIPPVLPNGAQAIASYRARLSENDHLSSTGARLDTIPDILRQDRANYYRFNERDREDEGDPLFADMKQRSRFNTLSFYGGNREVIVNGTPLVQVDVYPNKVIVHILSR